MPVKQTAILMGAALGAYGFGAGHPFGPDRMDRFRDAVLRQSLDRVTDLLEPVGCERDDLLLFHTPDHVARVRELSQRGEGYLDAGDTPAFPGIFEAACTVVGSVLDAVRRLVAGEYASIFIPIAGLHHARRDAAAGFCVFNDCGVAIEALRHRHGIRRIAYVDIDAHHGDGVFYAFESDPDLCFVDFHEDGRYLYPGTGDVAETGRGAAAGTKMNIPMPPGADDSQFLGLWPTAERFIERARPEFILLQAGADSVAGDPITGLAYSSACHAHAARRLADLSRRLCGGRLLVVGGGGYNRDNLAAAWTAVVRELADGAEVPGPYAETP